MAQQVAFLLACGVGDGLQLHLAAHTNLRTCTAERAREQKESRKSREQRAEREQKEQRAEP